MCGHSNVGDAAYGVPLIGWEWTLAPVPLFLNWAAVGSRPYKDFSHSIHSTAYTGAQNPVYVIRIPFSTGAHIPPFSLTF